MNIININLESLTKLRDVNERLMSYNIEMTEVTGGTFWKAYTPKQVSGEEEFPPLDSKTLCKLWQTLCKFIHLSILIMKD